MPTILITGANRGVGRALAKAYSADGWTVWAACRDPAAAPVEAARSFALDIADEDSFSALSAAIGDSPIDLLWNNAGVYLDKGRGLDDVCVDDWLATFRINTVGPVHLAWMLRRNVAASEKRIMAFTTSRMGSIAQNSGGSYLYRSSKAALNMAVDSLTKEVSTLGIKTVLLHPGWVRTEMGGPSAAIDGETSAAGLKTVVDGLHNDQSGAFLNFDGSSFPW
jgi:NAD(P)-dependent dehydrogenase (short-subunit alcohol dehydrogenase family)